MQNMKNCNCGTYEAGLLSIIVPVYNAEKYLGDLVDSLIHQTYLKKEIILVDDGSTDRSPEICDKYAEQSDFVRVIHKKNGGVVSARNRGIEEAHGEYITLPDNDDVIDYQGYEILIDALRKTDSDVAACRIKLERSRKITPVSHQETIPEPYVYDGRESVLGGLASKERCLCGQEFNKVFRREAIGNIRFRPVKIVDDLIFSFEVLAQVNRVAYIDLPLYRYRYTIGSDSKTGKTEKFMNVLHTYEGLIEWCTTSAPQCLESVVTNYLFWNINTCAIMLQNQDKEAFAQIQKNIATYQSYIPKCSFRQRIQLKAIMISWYAYKPIGMSILYLKKLYGTYIKMGYRKE